MWYIVSPSSIYFQFVVFGDNIRLCPAWRWIILLKNFASSKLQRFWEIKSVGRKDWAFSHDVPRSWSSMLVSKENKTVSTLVCQTSLFLCKRFLLRLIIMNSCQPRECKRCRESVFEICDRRVTLRLDVTFHGHYSASNNYQQAVPTNRLEKGVQNFFFIAIHQNYRGEPCKQQLY